jgi:hypothetical protein
MKVRINIERLVLDVPAMNHAQGERLRTSLAAELTRLLGEGGLSREMLAGARLRTLSVDARPSSNPSSPATMGRQVASAVQDAIGSGRRSGYRSTQRAGNSIRTSE